MMVELVSVVKMQLLPSLASEFEATFILSFSLVTAIFFALALIK